VRYAVGGIAVNGAANALTRANGMQAATLAGLGAASHFLLICASAAGVSASSCGPAANQLTPQGGIHPPVAGCGRRGEPRPPAAMPPATSTAIAVFVFREPRTRPQNPFDDIVLWVPVHLVASRLIAAGRLP
jgi:hypothetical protein